jgi:hypothetical protein
METWRQHLRHTITQIKNFIGPASVGFTLVLLSIVGHKFNTSCDNRGCYKRDNIRVVIKSFSVGVLFSLCIYVV